MTDPAAGLSVLHVIVRAGPTNSQYNEHCLPVARTRRLTVCSLFPAEVDPPPPFPVYSGDGTVRGCFAALRRALSADRYDVVHVHAPASGVVTLLTCLRMRRPLRNLVFTVHNSWGNFTPRNRLFLRAIIALFPLVVLCGHAAYESLPVRLRRLYGGKLAVVPNGVDLERVDRAVADGADLADRLDRPDGADGAEGPDGGDRAGPRRRGTTLVSVNRLLPLKDPMTLLGAFARARRPDDRLVLVGDGPLRADVQRRADSLLPRGRVELTGVVPRDQVYRRLASADLFVSTSRGEGLPVALLEAMACRVPAVVSDIPPHREVAQRAGGLVLVPPGDEKAFALAIEDLRALTAEQRAALGERMRRCVAEHYSVGSMNHGYGRVYQRLLEGDPRREAAPDLAGEGVPSRDRLVAAKLRQRVGLLGLLTVVGGVLGFTVASIQSPVYKGETSLQVGRTLGTGVDEEAMKTSTALAVRYTDLVRRERVLAPVAEAGFASSWKDLQGDVFAQLGDKNPQLVQISVYAGDEREAGRLARAVARSLVREARAALDTPDNTFLRRQLDELRADIDATTRSLADARAALPDASEDRRERLASRIDELRGILDQQRSSFAELSSLDSATVGSLLVVDEAWTTRSPLRPAPLVLGVAGAAAGGTIALAWAHLFGRPRLQPSRVEQRGSVPVGSYAVPADPASAYTNGHPRSQAWAAADS